MKGKDMEITRVDHDYFNGNRTEISRVGYSDTREGAVDAIEADAETLLNTIINEFDDETAGLTFGINADYELIGEELYSEYFIRNA